MAKYGLISGAVTAQIQQAFSEHAQLEFERTWETIKELEDSVLATAGNVLAGFEAILILDYAFDSALDEDKMADDIVQLENILNTQRTAEIGIKLYYITKTSGVFKQLKGSVNGIPGDSYPLVHILALKDGKYDVKFIKSVLEGKHDLEGIYNHTANLPKSRAELAKETGEKIIEDSQLFDANLVEHGDEARISDIQDIEFSDSKSLAQKRAEDERKAQEEARRIEQAKRRGTYVEPPKPVDNSLQSAGFGVSPRQEVQEVAPAVKAESPRRRNPSKTTPKSDSYDAIVKAGTVNVTIKKEYTADEHRLVNAYGVLKARSKDTPNQKLETDRGAISFIGERNSGVSGLVAQTAELYASFGRNVLVLDLDIYTRSQTVYFPTYDALASKQASNVGLIKAIQGVSLKKTIVPVTPKIDLLSISREDNIPPKFINSVSGSLLALLAKAKRLYDIVLVDVPLDLYTEYLRALAKNIDRNVFVVRNLEYELENMFVLRLGAGMDLNEKDVTTLIRKSTVILNQYRRGMRDKDGFEITTQYVKSLMEDAGSPFDTLLFSGEIPFYDDWEIQFDTNLRYIWKDVHDSNIVLETYKGVISRILM